MPVRPFTSSLTAASSGSSELRNRAARPSIAESSVILTVSLALPSRPLKSGRLSRGSAAHAGRATAKASASRIRIFFSPAVFMALRTCISIHTAVGDIQLLARDPQGFDELLTGLQSAPFALDLPEMNQHHCQHRGSGKRGT